MERKEAIKNELPIIIKTFVDFLMPELTPYEVSLYLFLLRNSFIENGNLQIRIGKRTIAERFVKGVRGNRANYEHITTVLKALEEKKCIKVGDTDREGTFYEIYLPMDIDEVKKKTLITTVNQEETDYFNDVMRRKELFERDNYNCFYCGEK